MNLKRNIVTPYLTFLFLVVGVSGILMLFHIFDDYTKVVHELLGTVFVIFSVLHVIINWKSLKTHFKNKAFIVSGIVTLIFSICFVVMAKMETDHEGIIIEKITDAPISESFDILNLDYNTVEKTLNENNIIIGEAKSIKEIGTINNKSAKEIIELIIE